MGRVREFTRRHSFLLVAGVGLFIIAPILSHVLQASGLDTMVDGMYEERVTFWGLMFVTRVGFAAVWFIATVIPARLGRKLGWLVPSFGTGDPDYQGSALFEVLFSPTAGVLGTVAAEVVIRVYTNSWPPYMP